MAQQAAYIGTGRRKDSVARVRLVPGNGKITVNGKDVTGYVFDNTNGFQVKK